MKWITSLSLFLLVSAALNADDTPKKDGKKSAAFDAAKLIADWTYATGTRAGEKVAQERLQGKVKITKDTLTLPAPPGAPQFVIGYKLDVKATPVTIDMEIKDGPVKEGKAKGIIALDGDEIKLCYHPTGGDRPIKFESTKENGAFLFVLKRAK